MNLEHPSVFKGLLASTKKLEMTPKPKHAPSHHP